MREVILDIETTGLSFENGDRITEIACIEVLDKEFTGTFFQVFINPQRLVTEESLRITGLTDEFLRNKPKFLEIADDFLSFIQDSPLVAHNAKFDIGFLKFEFSLIKYIPFTNIIIDTLEISRKIFPKGNHSLNALCRKYKIPLHDREKHGALIDSKLLGKVYSNLCAEEEDFGFFSNETELNNEILELKLVNFPIRSFDLLSNIETEEHLNLQKHINFNKF